MIKLPEVLWGVCVYVCVQIDKLILKSIKKYKGLRMVQASKNKFRGLTTGYQIFLHNCSN